MTVSAIRIATFFLSFVSIATIACARGEPIHLEARDIQFFKVSATQVDSKTTLHLSGLAFHSALAVDKLSQVRDGNTLRLTISLVPARPGLSGSFDYTIVIPPKTLRVTFGDEQKVIWARDVLESDRRDN